MLSPRKSPLSRQKNLYKKTNSPQHTPRNRFLNYQSPGVLKNIPINPKLQSFMDLDINPLTNKLDVHHNHLIDFKGLPSLQNLEELNCSNNNISSLYRFPCLPKLKKIKISNNPFSLTKNYRISLIIVCPSLQIIDRETVTIDERLLAREFDIECYDLIVMGWILEFPPPTKAQIIDIKKNLANGSLKSRDAMPQNEEFSQEKTLQQNEEINFQEEEEFNQEEAKRIAAEEEAKRLAEEEAKRLAEEEAKRIAAEEEAKRLAEEEAKRIAAEEEAKRLVEEEAKRIAAEEEAKRIAVEEEAKRLAEEEAKRIAAEEEAKRIAAEEETKRLAEEEAKRIAAEEEAKRLAEEAKRIAAEEEEAKRLAEEAKRIAAEEEAKRIAAEEEAKRIAAEEEAKRLAEEAKRIAAEEEAKRLAEEAKRIAAEEEAKRIAAEEEAKRIAAEEEAKRIAAEEEAKRLAEEEAKRIAAEEETKRLAEEEAKRIAAEEEAKRLAEEEAKKIAAEEEASQIEEESQNSEPESYPESKQESFVCETCKNPIDIDKCLFYSGYPYHIECIKCMICGKQYETTDELSSFVNITPGLFICRQHYQEYQAGNEISPSTIEKYHEQNKKNFIKEAFNPPIFNDEDIHDHPPEDIFITNKEVNECIQMNIPYEYFIPTITFHFDKKPEEFNYDQFTDILKEISDEEVIILDVEHGSVIIKVAFLLTQNRVSKNNKFADIIAKFKKKIKSTLGKSIIGNLVCEPEISIPDDKKIRKMYNKPSMNLLQNTIELSSIEIEELKKRVFETLRTKRSKTNWKFVFEHEKLYEQAEEQIREDIKNNQYEMIVVGQTIIANKYLNKYEKIKNQISPENVVECFLYHGTRLKNHQKIVKKHFLMPGQDKLEEKMDDGYYGKGIYATENLFYACLYANGYEILGCNEKTCIICCRVIYNKSKVKNLNDLSYKGKKIDKDIKKNYGINHALVGSSNDFLPISASEKEDNDIYGEEFVFADKYQIIPICSFTMMRKDHYILWKDEKIDDNENLSYLEKISKQMEVNIYPKRSVEESLEIIRTKKHSKIKLITNAGQNLSGKKLIEESRKIIGSNFICLVFASSLGHMEWVRNMENVLFTNNPDYFKKFAKIKLNQKEILEFANELMSKYDYKFKINEDELLKFPHVKEI